ncbi:MAG: hypothetical protein JST54_05555 [Deltaproteobacteria bacterium]|nr:hypothetical protein [Deltaproteobacteria bacterium]
MPRNNSLPPQDQLPTLESAIAVREAFRRYADDPFAELGMREAELAEKYIRKDLKSVIDAGVRGTDAPIADIPQLTNLVLTDGRLLKSALAAAGTADVPNVSFTKTAALTSADTLLNKAAGVKDPVIGAIVPRLKKNVLKLVEADKRVQAGGHASFDLKTSNAAKSAWRHLDNAYDLLGICMRNAGIESDPVYESRPKTPTDLRLKLQAAPKKARSGTSKARAKAGTKSKGQSAGQQPPPASTPPAPAA